MAKRSNAAKGSYYRGRTQKWLEAQGYVVALLERMMVVHRPGGAPLFIKRDQLGCDLLAVGPSILFVQVKFFGTDDRRNQLQIKKAMSDLHQFPCPPGSQQWLVIWKLRAKQPTVIVVRG